MGVHIVVWFRFIPAIRIARTSDNGQVIWLCHASSSSIFCLPIAGDVMRLVGGLMLFETPARSFSQSLYPPHIALDCEEHDSVFWGKLFSQTYHHVL